MRTALRAKCAQSCPTLCNPMNCSPPGSSLSMGFSRQEYCSGLPFPSPGDLPNTGLNSGFLHCRILYRLTYQGTALDLNNTLVKTNELICQANEHYYRQNSILYSNFLSFYLMSFFCPWTSSVDRIPHYIK